MPFIVVEMVVEDELEVIGCVKFSDENWEDVKVYQDQPSGDD